MNTREFRSVPARALVVGATVAAAAALWALAQQPDELLRWGAVPVLVAVALWAAYWYPLVRVDDAGVTLRNVTYTVRIPWGAVRSAQVRWSLEVTTDNRTWRAWATPRASGMAARGRVNEGEKARAERLTEGAHADAVVLEIAERLARDTPPRTTQAETVRVHVPLLLTLAMLALAAAALPLAV